MGNANVGEQEQIPLNNAYKIVYCNNYTLL